MHAVKTILYSFIDMIDDLNDIARGPFVLMNVCVCWTAALAKKYYQVLQRYYVQYMSGYDADLLNQLIQVK